MISQSPELAALIGKTDIPSGLVSYWVQRGHRHPDFLNVYLWSDLFYKSSQISSGLNHDYLAEIALEALTNGYGLSEVKNAVELMNLLSRIKEEKGRNTIEKLLLQWVETDQIPTLFDGLEECDYIQKSNLFLSSIWLACCANSFVALESLWKKLRDNHPHMLPAFKIDHYAPYLSDWLLNPENKIDINFFWFLYKKEKYEGFIWENEQIKRPLNNDGTRKQRINKLILYNRFDLIEFFYQEDQSLKDLETDRYRWEYAIFDFIFKTRKQDLDRLPMLKILKSLGADVNGMPNVANQETPLYILISEDTHDGTLDAMRFLLEQGADVNLSPTPLMLLAIARSKEHVQLLLDYGADLHQVGGLYKAPAIIYAAYRDDWPMVEFLLEKGADIVSSDIQTLLEEHASDFVKSQLALRQLQAETPLISTCLGKSRL